MLLYNWGSTVLLYNGISNDDEKLIKIHWMTTYNVHKVYLILTPNAAPLLTPSPGSREGKHNSKKQRTS